MKMGVWKPAPRPLTQSEMKLAMKGFQTLYPNGYEPADWTGIGAITTTRTTNLAGGTTTEYDGEYAAIKNLVFS